MFDVLQNFFFEYFRREFFYCAEKLRDFLPILELFLDRFRRGRSFSKPEDPNARGCHQHCDGCTLHNAPPSHERVLQRFGLKSQLLRRGLTSWNMKHNITIETAGQWTQADPWGNHRTVVTCVRVCVSLLYVRVY
jgi:hypothetical protein